MEQPSNPIKGFLDEASSVALQEAHADLEMARLEVSRLSFANREVSAECTDLRKDIEIIKEQLEIANQKLLVQEGETGSALKQVSELSIELALLRERSASLPEKEAKAKAALEQSELTTLQLIEVQQELKYQFLLARQQAKMLSAFESLVDRATGLVIKTLC